MSRKLIYATANLIGIAVGVGIFGIPFAFAKASFFIGLAFLVGVAILVTTINLIYGEIILRTTKNYQLAGYAKKYLGEFGKRVAVFSFVFGILGALLAYVIISGDFLFNIFSSLTPFTWSLIFVFVATIIASLNLKTISWFELLASVIFSTIVVLILVFSIPHIETRNFSFFFNEFWFLPYGVILFAFGSLFSIPLIRRSLDGEDRNLKKTIIYAMSIVMGLYAMFTVAILGVSGDVTSPDAISGLFPFLGNSMVILGSVFGILAVTASFVILSRSLVEFFVLDYKFRKFPAWLLAVAPPIIMFIAGLRRFIDVISLVGAVTFGIAAILIMLMFNKARERGDRIPDYAIHLPMIVRYVIIGLFGLGIIYTLFFY